MGEQKVVVMILIVDLQCSRCYKKVKKILCKFPQIRDQVFNEKANTVTIRVRCCDPEKIRDKLCCKGGGTIKSIEIKEPGGEKKKPVVEDNTKPPEPVAVPEPEPKPKPRPGDDKPKPSPGDKPEGKEPAKPEEEVVIMVPLPAPAPPAPEPKPQARKPAPEFEPSPKLPELSAKDPEPEPPKEPPEAVEPPSWPPCYDYGRPCCYSGCRGMCPCCCAHRCDYIVVEENSVCTIM